MGRASILASIPCFVTDELWLTTTSDSLVNSLLTPRNISICIIMVARCVIWQVLQSPYATSVAKYRNHKPKDFQSCIISWQLDLATPPISRQKSNENTVFHGHCLIASVRETLDLSLRSPTKNWKSHLTRHAIKAQQQAWPFHAVRQRWVAQGSLWQRWVFNRALLKDYYFWQKSVCPPARCRGWWHRSVCSEVWVSSLNCSGKWKTTAGPPWEMRNIFSVRGSFHRLKYST